MFDCPKKTVVSKKLMCDVLVVCLTNGCVMVVEDGNEVFKF